MFTNPQYNPRFILPIRSVVIALTILLFSWHAPILSAQGVSIPCPPNVKAPTLTVKLADAIAETVGGKAINARGTFFQNKITIDLIGNDAVVCLASSPALAPLQVDDQLELLVGDDKSRSESWVYDFFDKNSQGIAELPAQNISRLFAPGANIVRIELRDFKPEYYSTRQVWLVIGQGTPSTATSTPRATATPLPTSITLGIEKVDLGRLESLADSANIVIPVTSTSAQTETITLAIANLPSVHASPTKFEIAPRANTNLAIRLAASGDLPPQVYSGVLAFGIQSGSRLTRSQVPITFEIVKPTIKIDPTLIDLDQLDRLGPEIAITINLTSNDLHSNPIRLTVDSHDVQIIRIEPDTLAPNETRAVRVTLASSANWGAGDHTFALKLEAPRSTVIVSPEKITVRFRVPSIVERVTPFFIGALVIVIVLAAIWFTMPAPQGQLVGITAPTGHPQTFDLARYISPLKGFRKQITIGSARDNDIRLIHPSVAPHHAAILAQRRRTIQRSESVTGARTALSRRTAAVLTQVVKTATTRINDAELPATGQVLEWHDRI